MEVKKANPYGIWTIGRQQTSMESDYLENGVFHRGINAPLVMVPEMSAANLAAIADLQDDDGNYIYPPCTIAYVAGFRVMKQLDIDRSWATFE